MRYKNRYLIFSIETIYNINQLFDNEGELITVLKDMIFDQFGLIGYA